MLKFTLRRKKVETISPETKAEFMAEASRRKAEGNVRNAVTDTDGYKLALEHFESYITAGIASKKLNFDVAEGIRMVFDYFEQGKNIAELADKDMERWENEPE